MSSTFQKSFRDEEGLLKDLGEGLLFDPVTSDVALRVGSEVLPAHRAMLAARSPVFRAMFFGPMLEASAPEVGVNAFEASTMRLLLRFLYTGRTEEIGPEDMIRLLACADHYGVQTLRDSIFNLVNNDCLSPENACCALSIARTYRQDCIMERCLSFIIGNAEQVVETEGFLRLDAATLMRIFQTDDVRIEEAKLFQALVRWSRAQEQQGPPGEKQAELFASIRYERMTGQQLVTEVKPLVGEMVPLNLYMHALEKLANPDREVTLSIITKPTGKIRYVKLDYNAKDSWSVGFDGTDVKLENAYASTKHAMIYRDHGRWYIQDLNSRRGVYMNGNRLPPGEKVLWELGVTLAFVRINDENFEEAVLHEGERPQHSCLLGGKKRRRVVIP